jgi:hypothetical protein
MGDGGAVGEKSRYLAQALTQSGSAERPAIDTTSRNRLVAESGHSLGVSASAHVGGVRRASVEPIAEPGEARGRETGTQRASF